MSLLRTFDRMVRDPWAEFMRSLPPIDAMLNFRLNNLNRRAPGTCVDFFTTQDHRDFQKRKSQLLLCVAAPGTGKSILASVFCDKLARENHPVASLFGLWGGGAELKRVEHLLALLLHQLALEAAHNSRGPILSKVTRFQELSAARTLDQVTQDLTSVMRHGFSHKRGPFYFVLDGLDEFERESLRILLARIYGLRKEFRIKIFATSRSVVEGLEPFQPYITTTLVEPPTKTMAYVIDCLQNIPETIIPEKTALASQIIAASGGIPIITDNIIKFLQETRTEAQFRRFFKSMNILDKSLTQIFDDLTRGVLSRPGSGFAWEVIQWLTFSVRPLTIRELQHALAADVLEDLETLSEIKTIISDLDGIIHYDNQTEIVRFFHQSVREYFLITHGERFPRAHEKLTSRCIAQISHIIANEGSCQSTQELQDRCRTSPFLKYAACNWGHHAQKCPEPSAEVMKFLRNGTRVGISSQAIMMENGSEPTFRGRGAEGNVTGLHLAAYFGLQDAASLLLQSGESAYCKDASGHTPLWWAAEYHQKAVMRLLSHCDVLTLRLLVQAKETALIESLLESGCDVNAPDIFKKTPLHLAVSLNDVELVTVLISAGADMSAQDINGLTAPELALDLHSSEMLMVFLANHADTRSVNVGKLRKSLGLSSDEPLQLCQEEKRGVFLRGLRRGRQFIEEPGTERSILQVSQPLK
ncbi:hypothetical protein CSAL01_01498 [Colletotrichum salicis]|uniref:Uncharacterized protein n=1 Tax=Colletotrichum salicis TaxID=1209931 RepID=A0A135V4X4_9PEZI|nr:hypothetical protein CSAL01_01498 [Colletotrichum salicis]